MKQTIVANRSHDLSGFDPADLVDITRRGKWGNHRFIIGRDGTRAEVIAKHRVDLAANLELMAALHELQGKVLVCCCAPEPCHGDTLALAANALRFYVVHATRFTAAVEACGRRITRAAPILRKHGGVPGEGIGRLRAKAGHEGWIIEEREFCYWSLNEAPLALLPRPG